MSRHKLRNLFDSLDDLPATRTGKASLPGSSSTLGKRSASDLIPDSRWQNVNKRPAKPAKAPDSPSKWLDESLPPLPPQLSSSSGRKGSLGSPSLGEGVFGSPSLALILGKSTLLPSDMNLHGALYNDELVSIRSNTAFWYVKF